jgi:hypothetical protein
MATSSLELGIRPEKADLARIKICTEIPTRESQLRVNVRSLTKLSYTHVHAKNQCVGLK